MISDTTLQKIETLANEIAAREGVKIYDIDFSGGPQGRTLRVFIDSEKEGGVGIDDCVNVTRGLNELLDAEDPIPGGNYNLEVSSPGLERPLKKAWHYEQAVGKKVWLKLGKALENFGSTDNKLKNAKQITEVLVAVENNQAKVQVGEEQILIPFEAIEKAKLVFEFNEGKHDKKGPKKGPKK
jgi:ribosome maturation factor RimP